ncbi:c-type cytochrome [uncultured Tateyamaria sp.]|uniref:c-type cytochrome n=1 Tax=uncultured Tateyamaria sp. TaxID=455651 RepID=UPI00260D92E9|nr:c-type cytochrome [uncultured Tateyamaria sp.]
MVSPFKVIPVLVAGTILAACAPENREPDVSVVHGKALYMQKCTACHGDDGRGAGAESLGLGTPPPDLTTLTAQNRGVFPQNFVMSVIDGFNRRDHPSSVMPEFGNEDLGPAVQVEDGGVS